MSTRKTGPPGSCRPHCTPARVWGTAGRTGGSRTRSSSRGCTCRGSREGCRVCPSSPPPPGPRCNSACTGGGLRCRPVGRDGAQRGLPMCLPMCPPLGGERQVGLGSHWPGAVVPIPGTQHVVLDEPLKPLSVVGRKAAATDLVTEDVAPDLHCRLPQAEGPGQWFCKEMQGEAQGPGGDKAAASRFVQS